jgi:hypothetical protein
MPFKIVEQVWHIKNNFDITMKNVFGQLLSAEPVDPVRVESNLQILLDYFIILILLQNRLLM